MNIDTEEQTTGNDPEFEELREPLVDPEFEELREPLVDPEFEELREPLDDLKPEIVNEPERDQTSEGDQERKQGAAGKIPLALRITIAAAAVIVILFAALWETFYRGGQSGGGTDRRRNQARQESHAQQDHSPPRGRSRVQDRLSDLEWVTPAFIPINDYSRPGTLLETVNAIVIHYIGNPGTTAAQNRNYFANLAITEETYASSNFIVGLEGEIAQCVPVDEIAYASNARNADSLSIELCHPDETGSFNEETYEAAVRLAAWLCLQYGLASDDLIRHYDVTGKECPKYFVENEDAWEAFKNDVAAAMTG